MIELLLHNLLEGYRRLILMMLDGEISAVNPASTYRILSTAKIWDAGTKTPQKWDWFRQAPYAS